VCIIAGMKTNSIINRYIFKELIPPFVISIIFFTFIFLTARILDITNMIVNYKLSGSYFLLMVFYLIPYFLQYVTPMSIMISTLLTFLKMSSDNEIIALKAGGFSVYSLMPPVLLFCLIGFVFTCIMSIYGLPWGRVSSRELAYQAITSNFELGLKDLKERTFIEDFDGVMLYVCKVDIVEKTLKDVFIDDQRTKGVVTTVIAPKGELISEPGKLKYLLRLYNGTINHVAIEDKAIHSISFGTYDVSLDLKKNNTNSSNGQIDEKEMSLTELHNYKNSSKPRDVEYNSVLLEFYKKFSIPFACFALGILAVPLGMQSRSSKKSYGLGIGLVFFLLYYILLSAGIVFGEAGTYPPIIGMWIPNIVMGGMGLYLLVRAANDRFVQTDFLFFIIKRLISSITNKYTAGSR